jgi:D-amino peptidase
MRIYLMTDIEGVAGVQNALDWTRPGHYWYDLARQLLTEEVNAALDGFFAAGADEVLVADGHGPSAVDIQSLDPRAEYMRGWPAGWPLGLEEGGYDYLAFVGQHAKARTPLSNMTHTQSYRYLELSVNGVAIGEFGQLAMCASELGVRTIFAAGERALAVEAQALVPGIGTVWGKRGTRAGRGDECTEEAYRARNGSAVHFHPQQSRAKIRDGALRSLRRAEHDDSFGLVPLEPPYRSVCVLRPCEAESRHMFGIQEHAHSVAAVMSPAPGSLEPMADNDQLRELLVD